MRRAASRTRCWPRPKAGPEGDDPLRVDTIYDQERARLKVILSGSIATTTSLLKFITAYLDHE